MFMSPNPPLEAWTFLKQEVRLRGSTGAALRTLPGGRRVVVKRGGSAGGDRAGHIKNEYDMNRYLNELGVGVPNARMVEEKGKPTMLTDFEEGATAPIFSEGNDYGMTREVRDRLRQDFVPHALIGNWDVLGMDADNALIRPDGTPTYVDVGGAGPYRAQGAPKGGAFGPSVSDLDTMQYKPPYTEMVYGNMSPEELGQSYDAHGGLDAMTDATKVIQDPRTQQIMNQRAQDLARRVA